MARLNRRDPAAWSALLKAHERRLFNVCYRMVGNRDDAAELTQDTLVKIVQNLSSFRGEAKLSTWMTRVAINQTLSFLRKRKRRSMVSLDAVDLQDIDGRSAWASQLADHREPNPAECVQTRESIEHLHEAMQQLDQDFRAVLVLRDLQSMEYAEIAAALELPVGTVKSRLFRARLALRTQMQAKETASL